MRSLLLTTIFSLTELTLEVAARSVDVLRGVRRAVSSDARHEELERRLTELERDLAASRRIDRARQRELERFRAGGYWRN